MPNVKPRPTRALSLARRVPAQWRLPLGVFAGAQLIWLFWWAAFYPGLVSPDSVGYVWEVTTGVWSSDHSVLYDLLVLIFLHLPGRLGLLTLCQTTAMSAALAYTCVALRGLGVRARWSAPTALLLAAVPPTGTAVVFVWKDVPFYISAVLVFAATARLITGRRRSGPGWRPGTVRFDVAVLAAGLLGLGLFRNNGLGLALIAGAALVIALPGRRIRLSLLTAVAVVVPLAGQLWLYPAVGIKQPPPDAVFALNYSDIAVVYQEAPTLFSHDDLELLQQVAPLSTWRQGGNCYSADELTLSNAPFDRAAADRYNDQLMGLWSKLLRQRPNLIVDARICRGHIAWAPVSQWSVDGASTETPNLLIPADLWGFLAPRTDAPHVGGIPDLRGALIGNPAASALLPHPLSHRLHSAAMWLNFLFRLRALDWILWRGATWCYLAYAAIGGYALVRRRRAGYALAGVLVGQQLTVLAANPIESFRYVAIPLFIGPFGLGLVAALRSPATGRQLPEPAPAVREELVAQR